MSLWTPDGEHEIDRSSSENPIADTEEDTNLEDLTYF